MKIIKHCISLFLTVCLFAGAVKAQNSFSSDPAVFITEFTKFIEDSKHKESIELLKSFKTSWDTKLTPEQKTLILKLCNNMRLKKLTVDPYYYLLLNGLDNYFANGLNPNLLKQWQDISAKLLNRNEKEYLAFLQTANLLFSDNILYSNGQRKWYSSTNDFEFVYDAASNKLSIKFKILDLTGEAAGDKVVIAKTAGIYYPDKNLWVGQKGHVNWERSGLPDAEVSAELKRYKIDFTLSEYTADSAALLYPKFFPGKLYGRFRDKLFNSSDQGQLLRADYPQFNSYESTIEVKNVLGKDATYKGGFTMRGNAVNSQTVDAAPAVITLFYQGKKIVEARSKSFKVDSLKAVSNETALTIFSDTGVITHPKVIFTYDAAKKRMKVEKGTIGLMRMPFTDTYHGIEIDVEQIIWDQTKPYIDFDMISNDKAALIESNDFFKKFVYDKIQSVLAFNPLEQLFNYVVKVRATQEPDRTKRKTFNINDYAAHLGTKKQFVEEQIMDVADQGFLFYNNQNDSITVRDKLYDWVSNNNKVKDYDIIRLSSVISAKPNITLNLMNYDLKVEGVRRFNFSDSQNVISVPTEQLVIIKKNKNLHFAGLVRAGRIDFYSKDFNFDYGQFKIKNTEIDSMVLYYPDMELGALRKVQSVLSNTYGSIYIDKPNNKSGLIRDSSTSKYPMFVAERGSEITYDRAQTHNHAYKADRFKFEVDPFTIDSLDDFTIAGLAFDGTFKSDGIFPDIRNKATIQPDYSLGFVSEVKLPMYGKGKADMSISLSNRGLYGTGKIEYLGSTSISDEYLILPDQTTGISKSFDLPESAKYPLVKGENVQTDWYPKQDQMKQKKIENNFKMFKMGYEFEGTLTLAPADLRGDGTLRWSEAEFASADMVFGRNKSKAEKSSIKIYSADPDKIAFETGDVKGDVDFDKREGRFISNVTGSLTYFPYNMYASNMNDYKWSMDQKTIEVKPNAAMGTLKPKFISTNPSYDSLSFECSYAKFDLKDYVLYMEKIPYIDVADSRVFPLDGKAIVRQESAMDRLDSSVIVANRVDKFHEIRRCQTVVLGKNNLRATGHYKYVNKNKVEQALFLDSIRVDTAKHVVAYGRIPDTQNFTLDTKIGFKGLCEVISTRRPIEFIGYVRPMHSFTYMETYWMRYRNVVDPQNVIIDVHDPREKDFKKLSMGLYFANDSNHVYPIMFDLKRRYSDPELLADTGIMFFDHAKNSFMIGDEEKLVNKSLKGNYMQFDETDKSVYAEGDINLGFEINKVILHTAGNALHEDSDSTYRFNLAMLLDFPMPKEVSDPLLKLLTAEGSGTAGASNQNEATKKAIAELLKDKKTVARCMKSIEASNNVLAEDELKSGFLFTDANLAFERVRRKFVNTGNMGLALFNGKVVNRTYEITMTLEKKRNNGDKFTILIDMGNGEWLFMDYVRGVLYMVSSNAEVNQAIVNVAEKQGDDNFSLRLGTERSKDNFLRKLE